MIEKVKGERNIAKEKAIKYLNNQRNCVSKKGKNGDKYRQIPLHEYKE